MDEEEEHIENYVVCAVVLFVDAAFHFGSDKRPRRPRHARRRHRSIVAFSSPLSLTDNLEKEACLFAMWR